MDLESDDEQLLAQARSDPNAFGRFYARRIDAVLAFFLRRTRDRELALDLAAETFAAALQSVGRFERERCSALAWLFTIANRKLADSCRRGRVEDRARRRLKLEPVMLTDEDLERVEQRADRARDDPALAMLERLSAERRSAVSGRIIEERSYEELATELRCSEAVVRQRVSRGLAELRTNLEGRR